MKFDIIGGSNEARYKDLNSERTINWDVHVITNKDDNAKNKKALYPTPGLTTFYAFSSGQYIRGIFTAQTVSDNRCFVVVDTTLYELFINGTVTNRGSIPDILAGKSPVYMEVNGNRQLFICAYAAAYVFALDTNTLTKVTSVNYPSNATSLTYQDGYFVVTSGGRVYWSDLNNGLSWTGASLFTPTSKADPTIGIVSYREDLYCFGTETIEIYNSDPTTTWTRQFKSTSFIGLAATGSLCVHDKALLFLGKSRTGQTRMYALTTNTICTPLSTPNIDWRINQANTLDDAYAVVRDTKDGMTQYLLTIPDIHTTFVYTLDTDTWTERDSQCPFTDSDGTVLYREFRGKYYTNFNGLNLFTDIYSPTVFFEDKNNNTENGTTIRRLRRTPTFNSDEMMISMTSLELDVNTGEAATITDISPVLFVRASKDGGVNYNQVRPLELGGFGKPYTRAKMWRFGTGKDWVFEIVLTDPINLMIQSAIIHGAIGIW